VEEDLMRNPERKTPLQTQRGFSMVEMLMTAFILAVGIMGLTLLQVMSLKGARGGKSLGTAVQVGEMVMDQIEMEGRLSWLNLTATQLAAPGALGALTYINQAHPTQNFNIQGEVTLTPAVDGFYAVNTTWANVGNAGTGTISDFTVDVLFSDQADPVSGIKIPRHVVLTRRVLHG
jgi:prepilin-type N-terminal cleavage/methylation domain-containing protein